MAEERWITPSELLGLAVAIDRSNSESTLRWLRRKRLMPEAVLVNGRYRYPSSSVEQLRAVLRWRARGVRSTDARRLLVWVEGFPIPLEDIRRVLRQFVDDWDAGIDQIVGSLEEIDPAVLENLVENAAAEVAAKRSRSPLPEPMRKRRMPKKEREQALSFTLFSLMGVATAVTERIESAAAVDRLLGLDRRRKAVKRLLTVEDPLYMARAADPARLRRGAFDASPDELELARRQLGIGFRFANAFLELMIAELGPSFGDFGSMLAATPPRTIGPLVAFGITSLAGGIHENRTEIDIPAVLEALVPETLAYTLHAALETDGQRLMFRQALPERDRLRLEARLRHEMPEMRL